MIDLPTPSQPPAPPAPVPAGWEGILQPGEQILWQGQPRPGIDWTSLDYGRILFGLVFGGFATFWMVTAIWVGSGTPVSLIFPLFGLPFLGVGLRMVGEQLWLDQRRLRGTYYTLTDRAAFVAIQIRGRRDLQRYPLKPGLPVSLDDSGDTGNVWFGDQTGGAHSSRLTGMNQPRSGRRDASRQKIGFERIDRPREVWHLLGGAMAALSASDPSP
ncbi:MAG: hypothetical protein WAT09_00285 [Paracoccaceae bacterium]